MCGIAGAITKEPISINLIKNVISKMCKRGPDNQEYIYQRLRNGNHLYLLFSRLAILDLSNNSMQPISTTDGNLLVFNGEIYNYKYLKRKLEAKGIAFKSEGDAEVLCQLIENFGISSLSQVDGMFALAYFDARRESLFLARDFFGEKPLLTFQTNSGLFFGSQNSFIFEFSGVSPKINLDKCRDFLHFGYKTLFVDNKTFFEEVYSMQSGTFQEFDSNCKLIEKRFFKRRVPEISTFHGSFQQSVNLTRESVMQSVHSRLVSDVPITFCMSGGVDSTVLAAISKKELGLDFEIYSLASTDPRYDETSQVQAVCDSISVKPNYVTPSREEFFPRMQKLIKYHGAPVSTISYYIHSFLSEKIANDGYRVAIMGTGADELFSGYYDHFNSYFASLFLQGRIADVTKAREDWLKTVGGYIRNPAFSDPLSYVHGSRNVSHFNDGFHYQELFVDDSLRESPYDKMIEYSSDLLKNQMIRELFHESVPMILNQDDLNSMFFSVENRSPYLNYDLFSLAMSLPNDFLIRDGLTKAPLRHAFKNLLPDSILFSPLKVGFNADLDEFLPLDKNILRSYLGNEESLIWNLVSKERCLGLLLSSTNANSRNKFLFSVISLKLFLDNFS